MANTYVTGTVVRVAAPFRSSGAAIDPTTVQAIVKKPDGTSTTYNYPADAQLVKDSAGNYHLDVTTNADGIWRVRFIATGAGASADETSFNAKSRFV